MVRRVRLPLDERLTVDRGLRQLDFLAGELGQVDAIIAAHALGDEDVREGWRDIARARVPRAPSAPRVIERLDRDAVAAGADGGGAQPPAVALVPVPGLLDALDALSALGTGRGGHGEQVGAHGHAFGIGRAVRPSTWLRPPAAGSCPSVNAAVAGRAVRSVALDGDAVAGLRRDPVDRVARVAQAALAVVVIALALSTLRAGDRWERWLRSRAERSSGRTRAFGEAVPLGAARRRRGLLGTLASALPLPGGIGGVEGGLIGADGGADAGDRGAPRRPAAAQT
jgi:hypothetical protein